MQFKYHWDIRCPLHPLVKSEYSALLPYIHTGFPPLVKLCPLHLTHNPSTKGSSFSHPRPPRHNKSNVDVSGAWGFLQEEKFRQAVGGDDDFRHLLLRNSFNVNWRFPDLAAKCTVLILSQWTVEERIYLLWAYKPQ